MLYYEACQKDIKFFIKSNHIKSRPHTKNEFIYGINKNLRDETYTHLNPDFELVDDLVRRATNDCTKKFHRFKYKCVFFVKLNHATHGKTNYFEITNTFKNQ